MENKRWLNIVVDGNKAMEQYWTDIVSNYLEKIVRCFIGERQDHENYLGLVFYNANSELGYDMQFMNWTKDVNRYMENLSHLSFNGNDLNQSSMAEGLAEALVMYPKPCDTMTEREYYNAERHCILVAPGDPVPKTMPVCVPMIQRAQVIGQRLQACQIDFLEVAKKCVPLAVSLSVITPNPVPIFGAIFNLGNNVLTLSNAPISSYSTGQLTILLSKNFREAHKALKEKRIVEFPSTSVGSINTALDSTLFSVLNFQEESAASQATIGAKISEACNDLTPESVSASQPLDYQEMIFSNGTDQANVALTNSQIQVNLYEDIMAELNSDTDILPPMKRSRTFTPLEDNDLTNLFELGENPLDDINHSLGHDQGVSFEKQLLEVENELEKALNVASQNTPDNQTSNAELTASSSKVVDFTPFEVQAPAPNTGEGSSTGLFYENALQSWYDPSAISFSTNTSTLVSSSQFQTSVSNGNFAFPYVTSNSQMQPQPYSSSTSQLPMFPTFARESIGNFSAQPTGQHFQPYNQYLRNNMAPFNFPSQAFGANTWIHSAQRISPSYQNLNSNLYVLPSLDELQDYVHTWEGNLTGKINSSRVTVIKARAFRKTTTPLTLTLRWSNRLEISHLIPLKAVNHTKNFSHPIDNVIFHVLKYSNVDLYKHLKSRYMCAKIDLQCQSIILSPTERENFFVGTVFPGETLFIEPA
ncbi:unnamed protein product [Lathyrus oleraceus]|uniref:Mediator of RNA polymerase II transcription subunit 25 n=1 Tax=Pisum sativum TaxID=3888 RepID=A0A9D4YLM6_PEA|nr:mediator of RNA polymerase II transcription subunit 25-like isoform X2 [Pisum sativum]KAI5441808.1 hypothetical protein KIW84_011027 [Pisum sativum]